MPQRENIVALATTQHLTAFPQRQRSPPVTQPSDEILNALNATVMSDPTPDSQARCLHHPAQRKPSELRGMEKTGSKTLSGKAVTHPRLHYPTHPYSVVISTPLQPPMTTSAEPTSLHPSHVGQDKDGGEIWRDYVQFLRSGELLVTFPSLSPLPLT